MAEEIIKDDAPFEVVKDTDPFGKPSAAEPSADTKVPAAQAPISSVVAERQAGVSHEPVRRGAAIAGKGKPATAKDFQDVTSGLASGAAQSALGTGQMLTSAAGYVAPETAEKYGNMEADWQKYLQTIGSPVSQSVGKIVGDVGQFALGGEALEATKLAPYAAKLVPGPIKTVYNTLRGTAGVDAAAAAAAKAKEQESLIKTLADSLIVEPVKGVATGVGAGVTGAAIEPRTEETEAKRNNERWKAVWSNIPNPENWLPASALLGGGVGLLSGAAKTGVKAWDAMTLAQRKAALKAVEEKVKEQATATEKLASDAKDIEIAKADAAQQAVDLGMTKEQAEAHVAAAEQRFTEAKTLAEQIAADFKALPTKSQTELGEFAQKRLDQNRVALEAKRDEEVGFTGALQSAPKGKVVDMTPVVDYIDSVADRYEGTPTGNMLAKIKKELQGKVDTEAVEAKTAKEAAEELFKPKIGQGGYEDTEFAAAHEPAEDNKISIENANERRKYWNHLNNTKKLNALTSLPAGADDESTVRELNHITKLMNDSAGAVHKPYMDAVKKFREFSAENLDIFDAGGFKGVTSKNINTGDYQKLSGEVTKSLLKMARLGDDSLAEALRKDPEFKEQAKQYFVGELFGVGNAKKNITEQSFVQFFQKNQELLEEAGLTKEFKDLEAKFKAGKLDVEKAKQGLAEVKKETGKKVKTTQEAASDLAEAKRKQTILHDMQKDIELAKTDKTLNIDKLAEKSESYVTKLRDEGIIDQATHDALKEKSQEIEREYANSKQDFAAAEKKRNATVAVMLSLLGGLVGGVGGARWLGYTVLSNRGARGEE